MSKNRNRKVLIGAFAARCLSSLASAAMLALAATQSFAKDSPGQGHGPDCDRFKFFLNNFTVSNLVADLPDVAQLQDTNLVNAWGVSFSATSPFWVSDNGTGLATLYAITNDPSGSPHVAKRSLEVMIPGAGNPTGQVFNNTSNFNSDLFLFVSEDGTISGWRPALSNAAEVLAMRTNAVYKGVTLVTGASGSMLLAANFAEGTVDVYDGTATLIAQLEDTNAPDGFAPFNVQLVAGKVFVTFAKQDDLKHDDAPGAGNGLIDILDPSTGSFHRFVTGSNAGGHLMAINSPWGVALAPSTFGRRAGQLLVGNFGSGTIMAFDHWGHFLGLLESHPGGPIVIDGLWALNFGNGGSAGVPGTLYFSAGPDGENHGLFGSIAPVQKQMNHGHDQDNDGDDDQGNGNHGGPKTDCPNNSKGLKH